MLIVKLSPGSLLEVPLLKGGLFRLSYSIYLRIWKWRWVGPRSFLMILLDLGWSYKNIFAYLISCLSSCLSPDNFPVTFCKKDISKTFNSPSVWLHAGTSYQI